MYDVAHKAINIDIIGVVFFKSCFDLSFSDPPGARTQDPNIKSVVSQDL